MPTITVDDLDIHYIEKPSHSQPRQRVLYIHGTGCNATVFARHMATLADDVEAVAIDLPGHGQSAGNGFRGVADYAAYCAGLIRALAWENCIVAGHSMGGGIALALAVYDAKLLTALMMIDSGARLRVAPRIIEAARRQHPGTPDPRQGFADSTPHEIVAEVRRLTAGCRPLVIAKDWVADDTCDFMSRLGAIALPSLAVCGRQDPLTPLKYHEYLAANLPQCRLEVIELAGHWPFAEQPQVFDRVVSGFLATL